MIVDEYGVVKGLGGPLQMMLLLVTSVTGPSYYSGKPISHRWTRRFTSQHTEGYRTPTPKPWSTPLTWTRWKMVCAFAAPAARASTAAEDNIVPCRTCMRESSSSTTHNARFIPLHTVPKITTECGQRSAGRSECRQACSLVRRVSKHCRDCRAAKNASQRFASVQRRRPC